MEQIEKIQGTEKEFIKVFQELCYSRSSWQVWADLMAAMACTLANSVDKAEPRHTAREKEYAECIKRLGGVEKPAKCFAIVVEALERNPDQDFLGKLYMSLELGNHWKGQFFTPYNVCECMASITINDNVQTLEKQEWISVNDPACGAGATDTSGVAEQVTTDLESALTDVPANGHASITLDQSNNAAEIYSLATADVVSAFSETIPADGHVDVTLDQTNNAAAIYSECAGQVQSTFSQGFTASADVAVTLNWHITNPSASISTSSSGSSVSATIAGHASGGEVGLNGAELSWVGEEGLEYIIPTVPARRQRGIELWKSAGRTLGVLGPDDEISAHASGGIVGKEVSNTIPYFDTDSSSQDSEKTEKETVPTNVVSDKSGIVVQVNLSPQFNISDTNDSDVIRLIKAHIKELADDLGSEIATMLSEAYENTPVTT